MVCFIPNFFSCFFSDDGKSTHLNDTKDKSDNSNDEIDDGVKISVTASWIVAEFQ
jgi:hypothetical protein